MSDSSGLFRPTRTRDRRQTPTGWQTISQDQRVASRSYGLRKAINASARKRSEQGRQRAYAFAEVLAESGIETMVQTAQRVGISRHTADKYLRILQEELGPQAR